MNKYIRRYFNQPPEICICKYKSGQMITIALETDSQLEIAGLIHLCNINPQIEQFWFSTLDEYILEYQTKPEDVIENIETETIKL